MIRQEGKLSIKMFTGLLQKNEFVNKRKELQVSDTLSLCIKTPYNNALWMNHPWWEKKPVLK